MQEYTPPPELLDFLSSHKTYYLISHTEPDGDCLASSLALGHYLERTGKVVKHYNEGPFVRGEILELASPFRQTLSPEEIAADDDPAAVVLDCSTRERVGELGEVLDAVPVAVIDHHAAGEPFGDAVYVDPTAPATTVLVQGTIEGAGAEPDAEEAKLILLGLSTDTGFFRHLDVGSGRAFHAVARLVDLGASPKDTFNMMNGGKTLAARKLLGRLLERVQPEAGGKIALTYETRRDTAEFGRENRDSDTLYQLLMGTRKCSVVALIREEEERACTGSLRSSDDTDVSRVAKSFGGGGHKRAAGFMLEETLTETYERVRDALLDLVNDTARPQSH
ncbi:MAG: bifunctional oligoribonuclease/PAP phosphatase NrnA [Spirochaetes bacterium]|jgi:phosphoesterase RecJ-like protein|nr:bifunctional oligoribonuclease/PAP phosphatase NrnA [Spirochaetota bacterium]